LAKPDGARRTSGGRTRGSTSEGRASAAPTALTNSSLAAARVALNALPRCGRERPRLVHQGLYLGILTEPAIEALAQLELPSLRDFQAIATHGVWLAHLARAPWLPQLEVLDVQGLGYVHGSLEGMTLPRLDVLKLWDSTCQVWPDRDTAESLAALELPKLGMLIAGVLVSRDVAALTRAEWWPRLMYLDVCLCTVDDGGLAAVRALVRRPLPWLRGLTLFSSPLCAEALRLLAAAKLPRLNEFAMGVLFVRGEEFSECVDAARAILEGAPWRRQCGDRFDFNPTWR
jgi:hypothetical protein